MARGRRRVFGLVLAAATLGAAPGISLAQDAGLHHAQTGALLSYADTELKVLFAALTAKELDIDLTKAIVQELKRAITDAKKTTDRSQALLTDKQAGLKPELEQLRAAFKKAEDQLGKLAEDIDREAPAGAAEEEAEEGEEGKGAKKHDWDLLKNGSGWLAEDLAAARSLHGKIAKKITMPALKDPPKPKAKRAS